MTAVKFRIRLQGTRPLIMGSNDKVNPFDPIAKQMKAITGKRKKTEDDMLALFRLEWTSCMYYVPGVGPYIPADNLWRCIYDSATKVKMGPRIKEAVFVDSDVNPLAYDGPRDLDNMWKSEGPDFKFIKPARNQGRTTVMRCRPIFDEGWTVDATGLLDTSRLDFGDLTRLVEDAGSLVGLCEWRPRYGRFEATVEDITP